MPGATLIARHRAQDYGARRAVCNSLESTRREYGHTGEVVLVDPDDATDVFVLHRFPTLEQARALAGSGELEAATGRAGAVGAARIEIAMEAP